MIINTIQIDHRCTFAKRMYPKIHDSLGEKTESTIHVKLLQPNRSPMYFVLRN